MEEKQQPEGRAGTRGHLSWGGACEGIPAAATVG